MVRRQSKRKDETPEEAPPVKHPTEAARDTADEERTALTALRRDLGRDVDAWPPEHRHRYRVWEAGQLERKAGMLRAEAHATLARAADVEALAAMAAEKARAAALETPAAPAESEEPGHG